MVAFVHQRRKDRLSSIVSVLLLAGLIIPPAVVPTIFVLQALGLFKTLLGLILIDLAFAIPFAVIVLREPSSASIPREIDEAAIVDGASPMILFFRVIFPLIRPAVITVIVVNCGVHLQRLRHTLSTSCPATRTPPSSSRCSTSRASS